MATPDDPFITFDDLSNAAAGLEGAAPAEQDPFDILGVDEPQPIPGIGDDILDFTQLQEAASGLQPTVDFTEDEQEAANIFAQEATTVQEESEGIFRDEEGNIIEEGSFLSDVKRLAGIIGQRALATPVEAVSLGEAEGVVEEATGGRIEPQGFIEEVGAVVGDVLGQAAVIKASTVGGAAVGGVAGSVVPVAGTSIGAAAGAAGGFVSGLGLVLWNSMRRESEQVAQEALRRGATPEAAAAAADASKVNIFVTEGISLIPLGSVFGRAGKVFKASDMFPTSTAKKMTSKVFDSEVGNALSKIGKNAPRLRAATVGGAAGFVVEGTTEAIQGGVNDAFIAYAAGERGMDVLIESFDLSKRGREFLVAGVGAGIVTAGGAATLPVAEVEAEAPKKGRGEKKERREKTPTDTAALGEEVTGEEVAEQPILTEAEQALADREAVIEFQVKTTQLAESTDPDATVEINLDAYADPNVPIQIINEDPSLRVMEINKETGDLVVGKQQDRAEVNLEGDVTVERFNEALNEVLETNNPNSKFSLKLNEKSKKALTDTLLQTAKRPDVNVVLGTEGAVDISPVFVKDKTAKGFVQIDLADTEATAEDISSAVERIRISGDPESSLRVPVENTEVAENVRLEAEDVNLDISILDNGKTLVVRNQQTPQELTVDSAVESILAESTAPPFSREAALERAALLEEAATTDITPPATPDSSAIKIPKDQPAQLSVFPEPIEVNSMERTPRQEQINKQTNTRTGVVFPPEVPGADNTAFSSDTGVAIVENAVDVNDPLFGSPDVLLTPELEAQMLQSRGIEGGLVFAPVPNTENTNAPEVIEELVQLARMLDGVFREASQQVENPQIGKSARGFFNTYTRLIRTQAANDIPTAAHEVAHLLDDMFLTDNEIIKVVPPASKRELLRLGKALYGSTVPNGGYRSEGWAEFLRIYMTRDRALLKKEAPETLAWWEKEVSTRPEIKKQIDKVHRFATAYQGQTAQQRAANSVKGQEAFSIKMRNLIRRVKSKPAELSQDFIIALIEEGQVLKEMEAAAAQNLLDTFGTERGIILPEASRVFNIYDANRGTAGQRAGYMVNNGMLDWALNPTGGKSLAEVVAPVNTRLDDFSVYLWAKRALVLHANGKNPGITLEDTNAILHEIETSEDGHKFELAANEIQEYIAGVQNYAMQAAPYTIKPLLMRIREADPGFYVPLQREFSDLDGRYSSVKKAQKPSGVVGKSVLGLMKQTGSGRRVTDPIEGIIQYTQGTVAAAHHGAVKEAMFHMASIPGMAKYITEVDPRKVIRTVRDVDTLIDAIARDNPKLGRKIRDGVKDVDVDTLQSSYATIYALPQKSPDGEFSYFPIEVDGKLRWFEVDGAVYDAMYSSDEAHVDNWATRWLGILPARTFRAGTTTANISFSLGTNVVRDFRAFMVQTQTAASTPLLLYTWLPTVMQSFVYAASQGRTAAGAEALIDFADRSGVFKANFLAQDEKAFERQKRKLKQKGFSRVYDVRNIFDLYVDILSSTESATRIAEMKLKAQEMGIDTSKPFKLTVEQSRELLLAGKQVTTDFSAAGQTSRAVNKAVPFFNAAIQGPRTLGRAFKKDPKKVFARMAQGSALALLLWNQNKDEDWWDDLDPMERYLFTWVPVEIGGRQEMLRIPRSFEIDGLSMAMVEAIADSAYKGDPQAIKEWISSFYKASVPGTEAQGIHFPIPLPTIVDEIFDQASGVGGFDHFFNRPIVPEGMVRNNKPADQYFEYTTDTAKFVGKTFGISPLRIEHAIRGLTGSFGIDLIKGVERTDDVINEIFGQGRSEEAVTKEKELRQQVPVFGIFLRQSGPVSTSPRIIDELYELQSTLNQNRDNETMLERNQRLMLGDALTAINSLSKIARITDSVDKRRELFKKRRDIAVQVSEALEAGKAPRGSITAQKKAAKAKLDLAERREEIEQRRAEQ